jgi:hypothetical protein
MGPQLTVYYNTKWANIRKALVILHFAGIRDGQDNAWDNIGGQGHLVAVTATNS